MCAIIQAVGYKKCRVEHAEMDNMQCVHNSACSHRRGMEWTDESAGHVGVQTKIEADPAQGQIAPSGTIVVLSGSS